MSVAGYLALTLYVAAARNDANGDQRQLLRTMLPPMIQRMRDYQNDDHNWPLAAKSLLMRVHQIMGPQWRPKGEWDAYITTLLRGEEETQP